MSRSKFYLFLNRLCCMFRVEVTFYLFERKIASVSIPPKKKSAVVNESELIGELMDCVNSCDSSQPTNAPADEL